MSVFSLSLGNIPVTKVVLPDPLDPRIAPLICTFYLFLVSKLLVDEDEPVEGFRFLPPLFVALKHLFPILYFISTKLLINIYELDLFL